MNNEFTIVGELHEMTDPVSGTSGDRNWTRREFVIKLDTSGQWENFAAFSLWNERVQQLDSFQLGTRIEVTFSLNARRGADRWFNDLRVQRVAAATQAPMYGQQPPMAGGYPPSPVGGGYGQAPMYGQQPPAPGAYGQPNPYAQQSPMQGAYGQPNPYGQQPPAQGAYGQPNPYAQPAQGGYRPPSQGAYGQPPQGGFGAQPNAGPSIPPPAVGAASTHGSSEGEDTDQLPF